VSYVTVVRNSRETIHRAIESVQRQTYRSVEHVVLDGASTDGTLDVIRRYADRLDYFASEPDEGLYDALNKAIPLTRGDLICVLNSDDWVEPGAAEKAISLARDLDEPTIILTGAHVRRVEPGDAGPSLVGEWQPAIVHAGSYFTCADDCHNGVYATRSAYELSGPYDTTYRIAADFKWLMSCFESGVDFVYARDITVNYVLGGTSSDAEAHGAECVRAIRERFPFLTPDEAGGLYHSFFAFPTFASIPGQPTDRIDFLRGLLTRHSGKPQLSIAVAWALLADADRFRDDNTGDAGDGTHIADSSPSLRDLTKAALQNHPTAYRIIKRLRAAMRKG
jgi:glycosyltransferase involved in cell wall biosynthesis